VGDFNTPLSTKIGYPDQKKKKIKETLELKENIGLIYLVHLYRVFHPATAQYIFCSAAQRSFLKTNHVLGHKASLNKHKKLK
jgi:hypothetical protein